jgi:microcystin-dependent protein
MADYTVRFTDFTNNGSITVEENGLNNTDTSLKLVGQNLTGYGGYVNENFLHLLENFANTTAPASPVEGQLWYDTTTGVDQLKVYDGAAWVAAGGIKKAQAQPEASASVLGDIWVDTANLQAYIYSGSGWVLIGPDYSESTATGSKIATLVGTSTQLGTDVDHTVLINYVQNNIMSVYSYIEFTPKLKITGFPTGYVVKPGVNIPTELAFNGAKAKYYGTSEKAEALVNTAGTASLVYENVARLDTANRFDKDVRIQTNTGLTIGENGILTASVTGSGVIIRNKATDGPINFNVNNAGANTTALLITADGKHGLMNTSPTEVLDVGGNIKATMSGANSGKIEATNTNPSSNPTTGALVVAGGAGINGDLNIGGDAYFNVNDGQSSDSIYARNIQPYEDLASNIGTPILRYANVYANTFNGNLVGNVTGNVSGSAASAGKLASPTTFQFNSTGDVTATGSVQFDGQVGGTTKEWTLNIKPSFVTDQTAIAVDVASSDKFLVENSEGLRYMTQAQIVSTVPSFQLGMIMPYAGTAAPTGWALCHGQQLTRGGGSEESLYLIIGILYGSTDGGATTFNLPDFRGRGLVGHLGDATTGNRLLNDAAANTVGLTGGSETGTITQPMLPDHQHSLQGDNGEQYYASTNVTGGTDTGASAQNIIGTTTGTGISQTGAMLDIQNDPYYHTSPFTTVEYIIYVGDTVV